MCTTFCKFLLLCLSLDTKNSHQLYNINHTQKYLQNRDTIFFSCTAQDRQYESQETNHKVRASSFSWICSVKSSAWKWLQSCLIRQTEPAMISSESFHGIWIWRSGEELFLTLAAAGGRIPDELYCSSQC